MSVLTDYVEQLERGVERNQAILEKDIRVFEDLCGHGVEQGDATALREAEMSFKRALARFQEIEQLKQVLCGPKYRGLSRWPEVEPILLAIRGRYYQAYGRVERWRRNDRPKTQPKPAPRQERAVPFESPNCVEALHELLTHHQRNADGIVMAVSFIVIEGDPHTLRQIPMDGSGLGQRDLIERTAESEVRVALHHPAAFASDVIEKVVAKRFFSVDAYRVRAVIYRLSGPDDLDSPFVETIRLNVPRLGNLEVLTLNSVEVGADGAGVPRSRRTSSSFAACAAPANGSHAPTTLSRPTSTRSREGKDPIIHSPVVADGSGSSDQTVASPSLRVSTRRMGLSRGAWIPSRTWFLRISAPVMRRLSPLRTGYLLFRRFLDAMIRW